MKKTIIFLFIALILATAVFAADIAKERTEIFSKLQEKKEAEGIMSAVEFYYSKGADISPVKLIPLQSCENCFVLISFPVSFVKDGELRFDLLNFGVSNAPIEIVMSANNQTNQSINITGNYTEIGLNGTIEINQTIEENVTANITQEPEIAETHPEEEVIPEEEIAVQTQGNDIVIEAKEGGNVVIVLG
ncbi:MAG: hypothetical protein V1659_05055 [Candidatus Woesearchaeota archaeon]